MGFWRLRYPSQLARKLAALIVLFSSVLALIITCVELWVEYDRDLRGIDSQMSQIENAYLPSVAENVWLVDQERLGTLLSGITRLPNFNFAEIRVDNQTLIQRGTQFAGDGVERVFELRREHRGRVLTIGELRVKANYQELYRRTVNRLLYFLGANLLKTFFVVVFVFSLFYQMIGRHMVKVARHARNVAEDEQVGMLRLERREPRVGDELSDLVEALNHMRDRLSRQRTALQQQVNDLRIKELAMASALNPLAMTDLSGQITYFNNASVNLWQLESALEAIGRPLQAFWVDSEELHRMIDCLHDRGHWQGEMIALRHDGSRVDVQVAANMILNEAGCASGVMLSMFDLTERRTAETKISELAFFDQLTGLPNRVLVLDRLQQITAASARNNRYGALLFVDLDKFKTINDTLGHDMGDQLLQQVALRLMQQVRSDDTVARLGGDEFVVILQGLHPDEAPSATLVETLAQKVLAALNQPYNLAAQSLHSSASIGITLFKGNAIGVESLMKQAEIAMYKSKETGRNLWRFFDPRMESTVKDRAALESDLRLALVEQQFQLYYQPQVVGQRVVGAEALIRWRHPERGMVSPLEFIALAEETDLILPIGQWVLEQACAQLALWADQGAMCELSVAVNVSARQFQHASFVSQVLLALQRSGANPRRLRLELTESLLVRDVTQVIEKMTALKQGGVAFSLDDFGTGYSSLSYLKLLPLDQLKIDASFVRDVLIDPNDAAIAKTIVALAHSLDIGVIAEGVETEAQRAFLAESGCHECQGYLFSRPIPAAEFEQYVDGAGNRP